MAIIRVQQWFSLSELDGRTALECPLATSHDQDGGLLGPPALSVLLATREKIEP